MASSEQRPVILRYAYKGESLRNGRVLTLSSSSAAPVSGAVLLDALASEEANVPLHRVVPFFYSKTLEGWERLHGDSYVSIHDDRGVLRIEVMLEQPATSHERMATASSTVRSRRTMAATAAAIVGDAIEIDALNDDALAVADGGFFGVGVYNAKAAENVGTLWRSAFMLGASFVFTIGARNAWEKAADTYKAWRRVPAFRYEGWHAFAASAPYSATWVAVELGGVPLHEFEHPECADSTRLGPCERRGTTSRGTIALPAYSDEPVGRANENVWCGATRQARRVHSRSGGCRAACERRACVRALRLARWRACVELQRGDGRGDHHVRPLAPPRTACCAA
jgi:hypothetical protein